VNTKLKIKQIGKWYK